MIKFPQFLREKSGIPPKEKLNSIAITTVINAANDKKENLAAQANDEPTTDLKFLQKASGYQSLVDNNMVNKIS